MALKLNEQHMEILLEVREKLRGRMAGKDLETSEYICVQILQVLGRRSGITAADDSEDLPEEDREFFREMERAISAALGRNSSVGTYLADEGTLTLDIKQVFDYVAPLARLAWLDRMIETKVLA